MVSAQPPWSTAISTMAEPGIMRRTRSRLISLGGRGPGHQHRADNQMAAQAFALYGGRVGHDGDQAVAVYILYVAQAGRVYVHDGDPGPSCRPPRWPRPVRPRRRRSRVTTAGPHPGDPGEQNAHAAVFWPPGNRPPSAPIVCPPPRSWEPTAVRCRRTAARSHRPPPPPCAPKACR